MYNWHKSPFIRICLPLILGTITGKYWFVPEPLVIPVFSALALSGILFSIWIKFKIRQIPFFGIWILISFLFLGIWNSNRFFKPEILPGIQDAELNFCGRIREGLKSEKFQKVIADISFPDSIKHVFKVLLYLPKDSFNLATPGMHIVGNCNFSEINPPGNPFAFDYRGYLHNRKIHFQAFPKDGMFELQQPDKWSLASCLHQFKTDLTSRLRRLIPDRDAFDLVTALVLGDQKNMDEGLTDAYRKTGSVHILSVSGLHVAIVCHIILLFTGFFLKRWKWLQNIVAFFALITYVLLTGAGPAILRSGIMSAILLFAYIAKGKQSLTNGLAASALLMLLWQPGQLWDVGFQLSYLALIGILIFQPLFAQLTAYFYWIPKSIDQLLTAGFAAQLSTFPLVIYYFHQFPWYFWLSGILVVPIAEGLLWAAIGTLMIDYIFPLISLIPAYILLALAWLQNQIVTFIANLPGAVTEAIWIPDTAIILLTFGICLLAHAWMIRSGRHFLYCTYAISLSTCIILIHQFHFIEKEKWVIYQSKKGLIIDHIKAKQRQTWMTNDVDSIDLQWGVQACREANQINKSTEIAIEIDSINPMPVQSLSAFNHKIQILLPDQFDINPDKIVCDYLIIYGKTNIPVNETKLKTKSLVLCHSIPKNLKKKWIEYAQSFKLPYYDISDQGAFCLVK